MRLALSKMINLDKLQLKFVEGVGFRLFMYILFPKISSTWTSGRDMYQPCYRTIYLILSIPSYHNPKVHA